MCNFLGKKISMQRYRQYFIKIPEEHTCMNVIITCTVQKGEWTTIIIGISNQILLFIWHKNYDFKLILITFRIDYYESLNIDWKK